MNYHSLLIVFILQLLSFHTYSQFTYTPEIDSLLNVFYDENSPSDDRYSSVKKAIRGKYLMTDPDSSLILSTMYSDLAIEKEDKLAEASSYYFMGFSYFINGHNTEVNDDSLAFELMNKSLEMHRKFNNPKGEAEVYHGLGLMYSIRVTSHGITNYIDSSFIFLEKSVDLSLQLKDSANISKTYNQLSRLSLNHTIDYSEALKQANLGLQFIKSDGSENAIHIQLFLLQATSYLELGLTDKAADSYFNAYKISLREGNSFYIAHTMTKLENIFSQSQNHKKSIEILNGALDNVKIVGEEWMEESIYISLITAHLGLNNIDKAEEYFALNCPDYSLENFELNCAISKGNIELKKGNLDLAKYLFTEALDESDPEYLAVLYAGLGDIALQQKNFSEAEKHYLPGLHYAQQYERFEFILQCAKGLYEVYSELGKNKDALAYHELYLEKRLAYEASKNVAARASFEYKLASEKRIQSDSLKFASAKSILSAENKAQKNTIYSVIAGLGIISLLSLFLFRLYRKLHKQKSQISIALDEKENLLREIHHRVKNNLQVVSSLLRLQSNTTDNEGAIGALRESQSRVQSMSLIHQNLYQRENLTGIRMKEYLERLCQNLLDTYSISKNQITLTTHIEDLNLDIDSVIPLGLIINELITNSIKYAFPDDRKGSITVSLEEANNQLRLLVIDDGVGIKSMNEMGETNSFGYRLINSFSRKLEAEVSISGDNGTAVEMLISEYEKNAL